jgi:hypothetical protein
MAGAWVCIAPETSPNAEGGSNAVSSNVFYLKADSIKFDEGFTALEEKGKTVGALGRARHLGAAKYEPKLTISGIFPRPADLGLFMLLFAGGATHTAGDATITDPDSASVPVGAHRWVYAFADDVPQTVQITAKDAGGKYWRLTGAGLNSMPFKFGDDGVLSCDLEFIGLFGGEIANPSLSPLFDAATPFRQGDMTLEWLTGSATTKGFDFTCKAGLETDKGFSVVSDYPDTIQFGNDEDSLPDIAGNIDKRTIDSDDIDALHEGGQFAAVIKLTHRETIKRAAVNVTSSSAANPSVITCSAPHNLPTGTSTVVIAGHSVSSVNGTHVATKIDGTTFSIPVNVSVGGTGGTVVSDTDYAAKAWLALPGCQHVSWDPDDIANVRRRESKYGWQARVDEATNALATITVVNATAAYETYA